MAILQNCTKAEVYDTNGTLLCPATVQSGPMDSILVITPDSLDHREHDLFRIVFYDPVLGVLTCRCELSAPLDLPDHMTSKCILPVRDTGAAQPGAAPPGREGVRGRGG